MTDLDVIDLEVIDLEMTDLENRATQSLEADMGPFGQGILRF